MSSVTRDTSTSVATIWRSTGKDQFGRSGFLTPVQFDCCINYNRGREYTSSKGIKFVPAISMWFEDGALNFMPKEGDYVAKGAHASLSPTSVDEALPVKDVMVEDCSLFNEPDDVVIVC